MDQASKAQPVSIELSAKDLLMLHTALLAEFELMKGVELYYHHGNGTVHPHLYDLARRIESAITRTGEVPTDRIKELTTERAESEQDNIQAINELTAKGTTMAELQEHWV